MKNKKTITITLTLTLTLIGLFIFLFGVIGLTYAYWQLTLTQKDENLVYTDCLKLTVNWGDKEDGQNGFQLTDAYPMTNEELVKDFFPSTEPYHFKIENTCNNDIPISINIESLPTEEPNLDDEYVDVILWEDDKTDEFNPESDEILSHEGSRKEIGNENPKPSYKLTDNKRNGSKIISEAKSAYQLYKFKLPKGLSREFNLLLFMDYATPVSTEDNVTNNAYWAGKITLNNYIPTLEEVIKELPVQQDDSGETGIYEVSHKDASITWEGTDVEVNNLKQTELRYAGANPNNYVSFGDIATEDRYELTVCLSEICLNVHSAPGIEVAEYYTDIASCEKMESDSEIKSVLDRMASGEDYTLKCNKTQSVGDAINFWRIIGLVNTLEGQRVKLIKDESIGMYSWDSSSSSINNGYGVNEWSESDLMKLLNPSYEKNDLEDSTGVKHSDQYVNNSLYWNGKKGKCYTGNSNTTADCDFTNNTIPNSLKNMIETITWNTVAVDENYLKEEGTVSKFYEYERSNNTGKICDSSSSRCNDEIERTTSWTGKVGLIYLSDYLYANGWLLSSLEQDWILLPIASSRLAYFVQTVGSPFVTTYAADNETDVRPSVYLKSDVFVKSGNGSKESPFVLGI